MKQKRPSGVLPSDRTQSEVRSPNPSMSALDDTFWHSTYQRHGPAVFAFLSSRLGRRDVAEDLLQETFVRAIRSQDNLRDTGKVRSYLFSTANRLVLNRARGKKPVLFSEVTSWEDGAAEPADAEGESPEESTDLSRAQRRLHQVAEAMSPALRLAFEGAVLEHKSYAEIAHEQGWTEGQVRVNVCRARKKVIAEMRDLLGLEGATS